MNELNKLVMEYRRSGRPEDLQAIMHQMRPVVNSAMTSYAGGSNPVLQAKAKLLVLKAIQSYRPDAKTDFRNWAYVNLQGLRRHANNLTPFTAPERSKLMAGRVYKESQEFESLYGREPTMTELEKITGLPTKKLAQIRRLNRPAVAESSFTQMGDDGEDDYMPGVVDTDWQNIWAEMVYNDLDDTDRQIYDMKFGRGEYKGNPLAGAEIAKKLKISAPAVSQRTTRIANKLAESFDYEGGF